MKEEKMDVAPVGAREIREAAEELRRFRRARAERENRVREEEKFFRMRVAPKMHRNKEGEDFAPCSAWLVNTILQKHADMMVRHPPPERSDPSGNIHPKDVPVQSVLPTVCVLLLLRKSEG